MKKVMNLAKAIGVLALLFLSQAMFAQSYVSPQVGAARVEAKVTELLGTVKGSQSNPGSATYSDALIRHTYYSTLVIYLQAGTAVPDAVKATNRKIAKVNPDMQRTELAVLQNEALALLQ